MHKFCTYIVHTSPVRAPRATQTAFIHAKQTLCGDGKHQVVASHTLVVVQSENGTRGTQHNALNGHSSVLGMRHCIASWLMRTIFFMNELLWMRRWCRRLRRHRHRAPVCKGSMNIIGSGSLKQIVCYYCIFKSELAIEARITLHTHRHNLRSIFAPITAFDFRMSIVSTHWHRPRMMNDDRHRHT